ncbi:hypothetical protein HPP92_004274 [Vanilla planifolia]|uniref:14-3-3 domain-containing protein n=1 Tax=Vanilla planifolia TaxID=51239 RepID=A0A835VJS1_VANPL|nr:hypothetical protein HPP92_004274 [Vanilla planifolia]
MTVTECIGGPRAVTLDDLGSRHHPCCDPRLKPSESASFSAMAPSTREENVHMAKLAEQAERFEEMVEFTDKMVDSLPIGEELSVEEQQKEESRGAAERAALARDYRARIESELSSACDGILRLLETRLVLSAASDESEVFYHKMKGDYYRYLAEFKVGDQRKKAAENTLAAYKSAQDIATEAMAPTHPIGLGLALNFSVFHYEILNSPDRALEMAKQAFDEAIGELDNLEEESCKDSTLIMQLLRDNLTLWTSDMQEDGTDEVKEASKPERIATKNNDP